MGKRHLRAKTPHERYKCTCAKARDETSDGLRESSEEYYPIHEESEDEEEAFFKVFNLDFLDED